MLGDSPPFHVFLSSESHEIIEYYSYESLFLAFHELPTVARYREMIIHEIF
jgi:hypothetical protein